uniref:Portal protein n=1 Tax=viral metagenome TaxID=1070528 RepID=A0A6M3IKL4_9ZZZZ
MPLPLPPSQLQAPTAPPPRRPKRGGRSPFQPSDDYLEKLVPFLQKRYDESKKVVDSKVSEWDRYRKLYRVQQAKSRNSWESNLVFPKAHYIVETIHPQILSTIFSVAQWITFKHHELDTIPIERWFAWFYDRVSSVYMPFSELFKGTPIVGTGFAKTHLVDGIPTTEYIKTENFLPHPYHKKPGDIDGMPWVWFKFDRDFSELERAKCTRIYTEVVEVPVPDPETGMEAIDPSTGIPIMTKEEIPIPFTEQLYFNLDKVWDDFIKPGGGSNSYVGAQQINLPRIYLAEMWGEVPDRLDDPLGASGTGNYTPTVYSEKVITCVMEGDKIRHVIRCEPSQMKYTCALRGRDIYLKPAIASLYSVEDGEFYGSGAIQPVESLIAEMTEHHNMAMDNHKRAIMTILSVRERSGLGRRDLQLSPFNIWKVKDHADVVPVKFPDIEVNTVGMIHSLLDREIDRDTNVSQTLQGIPTAKRMTAKEYQGSVVDSVKRFNTFIQMADRLTLRNWAFKQLILMSNMRHVLEGKPWMLPEGSISITPDMLMAGHEIAFACSAIESEFSKYTKQERIPRLLQAIGSIIGSSGGKWEFDLPTFLKEVENVYDWPNASEMVKPNEMMIPTEALMQAASQGGPELQGIVQQVIQMTFEMMKAEAQGPNEGPKGGGAMGPGGPSMPRGPMPGGGGPQGPGPGGM